MTKKTTIIITTLIATLVVAIVGSVFTDYIKKFTLI